MSDLVSTTLEYGVLGLCALMVIFTARIIYKEQRREGEPRVKLLRFVYAFLGFCGFMAVLNAYVQIVQYDAIDSEQYAKVNAELEQYRQKSALMQSKLQDISIALEDKGYTELGSLAATSDPVIRERLERQISRLQERLADAQALASTDPVGIASH